MRRCFTLFFFLFLARETFALSWGVDRLRLDLFVVGIVLVMIIAVLIFSWQRAVLRAKETALENAMLHEKELEKDLEVRNRRLTAYTLNLIKKDGALKEVLERLRKVELASANGFDGEFRNLSHLLEQHLNQEDDWKDFKMYFENVHRSFLASLNEKHPHLSSRDIRLCALLRLNLNIKEMADLLGISPDSVKMSRYRLRQKLKLGTEVNLPEYLNGLE